METPLNFKIGDEVVVVRGNERSITLKHWSIGSKFVIEGFHRSGPNFLASNPLGNNCLVFLSELEHADIYDSPLEKALR